MEEKVLIKSEQYNVKKFFKIMVIIGVILSIILFLGAVSIYMDDYDTYAYKTYLEHQEDGNCGYWYRRGGKCWTCETIEDNPTKLGYALAKTFENVFFIYRLIPVAALALIGGLIYLWLRSYELTVTDKRIFGKIAWEKRVDLPVDSISATSTIRLLKGISVSTSSGRISFRVIKNADEIYTVINNLLIERQQEKKVSNTEPRIDEAEQLKKFKDLFDLGVITQEEYDAKKKTVIRSLIHNT